MLHVARKPYLGYQVCERCKKLLCRPPDTPWSAGSLVSVLTAVDSDPSTPCRGVWLDERNKTKMNKFFLDALIASLPPEVKSQIPFIMKSLQDTGHGEGVFQVPNVGACRVTFQKVLNMEEKSSG